MDIDERSRLDAREAEQKTYMYLKRIQEHVLETKLSQVTLSDVDVVALAIALVLTFETLADSSNKQGFTEFRALVGEGVMLLKRRREEVPE